MIDWNNAHTGNPMEDIARTTLMSVGFGRMMPEVSEAVECFIDVSLARYFEVSGAQRAQMDAWWPVVCAVRLADPVVELHPWLLAQVEEGLGYANSRHKPGYLMFNIPRTTRIAARAR